MTVSEFFTKLNSGATWSAGVSFKRAASLPLERYAVHASYAEAEAYASTNAVAYPGQILAVVETTGTSIYYIDQNMALQPVGVIPAGDGKTISVSDDGVISLYGIDGSLEEAKSYQPVYRNGALTWVELSSTTVEGLQTLIEGLRTDVDAINAKIGTVEENKTIVQMITEAQEAATYDDAEVKAGIAANTAAIATLNGEATVEGSVKKTVSDEIAKVVAGAPESFDTLKEVSDWISTHGQDAASMNSAILALQNILDGIGDTDSGESATVVAYVQAAIAALNIGDYATAANLTALAERVTTAEGKITTAEGKITTAEEKIATLEEQIVTKANDSDLAAIAKTGNVNDLAQTDGDYIIFDCGSSSEVI